MWKRVRKILLITAATFLLLITSMVAFVLIYEDEIEQRIIRELNETLLTEIEINGDIQLSLLSFFPNAALEINDIIVHGSLPDGNDTLLVAGRISMVMNTWDIITQNWDVGSIVIEEGDLFMHRTVDGAVNYQLTKPDSTENESSLFVNIDEAILEDIRFHYLDERDGLEIDVDVNNMELSGNFVKSSLYVEAIADLYAHKLIIKDRDYANNKSISLDAVVEINTDDQSYDVSSERLSIEGNIFRFDGMLALQPERDQIDIEVDGVEVEFGRFLSILPDRYAEELSAFNADGELTFNAAIKGSLSKEESPDVLLTFDLEDGTVKHHYDDEPIRNLHFSGSFSNGIENRLTTSELKLEQLSATVGGHQLAANLSVINFIDPKINLTCDGVLNLSIINPLLTESYWKLGGKAELNNLHFAGSVRELKKWTTQSQTIKGTVVFDQAKAYHNGEKLEVSDGKATISPWTIQLQAVHVKTGNSDLMLTGKLVDWKGYMARLIKPDEGWVKPLNVQLSVASEQFSSDDFATFFESQDSGRGSTGSLRAANKDYSNLTGSMVFSARELRTGKAHLKNVTSILEFQPGTITSSQLSADAFDGKMTAYGKLQFTGSRMVSSGTVTCNGMNVSKLFTQLDNFGQDHLTGDNLKGTLDASMIVNNLSWNDGRLEEDQLAATTDITLTNGELIDFKTLESLSKFIKLEELLHIEFKTLENQISIANSTVTIPRMIVRSSALNLSVEGSYRFDDYVDFRVKINMLEVLGNKFRKRNKEIADYEIIDDNSFNFYLSMKGPIDDLTITYDKKGLKERFQQQRDELRRAAQGDDRPYTRQKEYRDWETENDIEFLDWNDTIPNY